MAVAEQRTSPAKFVEDLGVDLAKQITAQTAVPCLLYTSPSPRDRTRSRMPSSA